MFNKWAKEKDVLVETLIGTFEKKPINYKFLNIEQWEKDFGLLIYQISDFFLRWRVLKYYTMKNYLESIRAWKKREGLGKKSDPTSEYIENSRKIAESIKVFIAFIIFLKKLNIDFFKKKILCGSLFNKVFKR